MSNGNENEPKEVIDIETPQEAQDNGTSGVDEAVGKEVVAELGETLPAVSPTDFKDSMIGLKGKDLAKVVNWNQMVYPSDDEFSTQMITSEKHQVFVKDAKPTPVEVGKKGEKRPKLDENGNQVYTNKTYAKNVSLFITEDSIRTYLADKGMDIMIGKLIGPIVAAGRNKNVGNPVPDGYNFTLAHVEAFYDGQTINDIWTSLLGQGWAPPTSRLSAAAAIAAACPVEFDQELEDKFFAYVAGQFDGAKKETFGVGDAATFRSLSKFIGKSCRTPRLPKSSYLSVGLTVLNQLSAKASKSLNQINGLIEQGAIPEEQMEDALALQASYEEKPRVFNHVLCALTEAHKQAIRKEAALAAKRSKTEAVAKDDDLLNKLMNGENISEALEGLADIIPNDMEI